MKIGFKYIVLLLFISQTATSQSWLVPWENRQPITLINYNYVAMEDYQVRIELSFKEGMQSLFQDIRITNASGNEILPHWLEHLEESQSATIWVKIDSIAPFGEADFYIYYANPAAVSTSNPNTTFVFYDDFDVDSGWNIIGSDTSTTIMMLDSTTSTVQKFDACGFEGSWKSLGDTIGNFKLITRDFMPSETDSDCTVNEYGVETESFSGFNLRRDAMGTGTTTEFGLEKRDNESTSAQITTMVNQPAGFWYRTMVSYCHICHFNLHSTIRTDSMSLIGEVYGANYQSFDFSKFTVRGGHTYHLDYVAVGNNLCIEPVIVFGTDIETCPVGTLIEFADDLCEEGLGAITINISGGIAPYILEWYNGQDSLGSMILDSAGIITIDSLSSGNYCFKVIDAEGCEN